MKVRSVLLSLSCLTLVSCADPLTYIREELKRYGYIAYSTPLEVAGTGTMIGGDPTAMAIIAHPLTCFPAEVGGHPTGLRHRDETTLPKKQERFIVDFDMQAKFFDAINIGVPTVRAGIKMKDVQTIDLAFDGVHIEYIDSVRLVDFYRRTMSPICKEYLDKVGFIIQAIAADTTSFTFYHKNGGKVELSVDKIKDYLDIAVNVDWEIEQNATLVIKTPKYLGYQLGALRHVDRGLSLLRASSTILNFWIFKELGIFKDENLTSRSLQPDPALDQFATALDELRAISVR